MAKKYITPSVEITTLVAQNQILSASTNVGITVVVTPTDFYQPQ